MSPHLCSASTTPGPQQQPSFQEEPTLRGHEVAGTSWYKCQSHMGPAELKKEARQLQLANWKKAFKAHMEPCPTYYTGWQPLEESLACPTGSFPTAASTLLIVSLVTLSGPPCYLCLAYF